MIGIIAAGAAAALASLWLRARRKLTVNVAATWGILGILLIFAGIFSCIAAGRTAIVFLFVLCGLGFSVFFSERSMRSRERAMELSLLLKENDKKRILFVINTMGQAGAERALLELLKKLDGRGYELFLYVLMGQGELLEGLPAYVTLLNSETSCLSVLSKEGRRRMTKTVLRAFFHNGKLLKKLGHVLKSLESFRTAAGSASKEKGRKLSVSKLLWRVVSDGADVFHTEFDLAVAWLEGGAAYYTADHVKAGKKCVFVHIDYENAGYTREMDKDCYDKVDRIFTVSAEVKEHFLAVYPEYESKTRVFYNIINREMIRRRAEEKKAYEDHYRGLRLLTVGRLDYQKGYDIAIEAMRLLKDKGHEVRWYVLGEGAWRKTLEKKIAELGLKEDFLLLGAAENPYPYYAQADIYVHMTRYEGKSVALQEAQVLGCAIIASDCNGNREQITDGLDGILCKLEPEAIAENIARLLEDEERRKELGRRAGKKRMPGGRQIELLLELLA